MALRAGYFGLKRFEKNKLSVLAASMPADIGPDNPIAGKNDVLATVDLLKDTTGWLGGNLFNKDATPNNIQGAVQAIPTATGVNVKSTESGSWSIVRYWIKVKPNTIYKISTTVSVVSGESTIYVQGSTLDNPTSYADFNVSLIDERNTGAILRNINAGSCKWIQVGLFATRNTEGQLTGDVTYSNLMIITEEQYALNPAYRPYHESVAELLDGKLSIGSMLTSADDLNDIKTSGIYSFSTSPANTPEGVVYGTLIVEGNSSGSTGVRQLIIVSGTSSGIIYTRGYDGSPQTWKSWFKFTGTEVTPPSPTPESETKKATKKKVIKEEEE